MSIRVVCPNGHVLNVKDGLAGKTGLCPKCKARVVVPRPQEDGLSEDAIMNILGPHVSEPPAADGPGAGPPEAPERFPAGSSPPTGRTLTPKKSCHKCNREISAEIHICPFCHTYIAELSDF